MSWFHACMVMNLLWSTLAVRLICLLDQRKRDVARFDIIWMLTMRAREPTDPSKQGEIDAAILGCVRAWAKNGIRDKGPAPSTDLCDFGLSRSKGREEA